MGKKLTYDFVYNEFDKKGYHLLSKEYKGANENLLIEKDGYKAYMKYGNFQQGKLPRFFSYIHNDFFFDNVKKYIKERDDKVKVLSYNIVSKNKNKIALINMQCPCGNIFHKNWGDIKGDKYLLCETCRLKMRGNLKRKDKTKALKYIQEQGYEILNCPIDYKRDSLVEVKNSDGYYGFISYVKLKSNKKMSIFDIRINKKNYIKNVNIWADKNNIKTRAIDFCDDNLWTRQGIKLKCECGNLFSTSISSFQNGKCRCDECTRRLSRYEKIVKDFLVENNIDFFQQYIINSCRDVLPLPFDFYIKDKKYLIEVDGEGHFKPCNFNQIGYEDALKTFEITKKHDEIKNNYCKKYNIKLLRIPYWDIKNNNYKQIILDFIEN